MTKTSTKCVYIKDGIDPLTGAVNPPIYQSAGFAFPDPKQLENVFAGRDFGHVYSRISNPTLAQLERRVSHLESSVGTVAVSSGLSAIFSLALVLAEPGQNVVVSNALFGGTRDLFEETIPKLGLAVRFCDISNMDNVSQAVDASTAFVFTEIISNPKLVVPDIHALHGLASAVNAPLVVDATLTGVVGFQAKSQGVDIIIHSSTKLMATNGGAVGGVVVDTGNFNWSSCRNTEIRESAEKVGRFAFIERLRRHALNNAGFNTSPMNAYFTMMGLETLSVRYQRISENAQAVAEFFQSEGVAVSYPGLPSHPQHELATRLFDGHGPLLSIDLGSKAAAFSFISKLNIVQNMSNLGDNRTMVIHPKSTIYAKQTDAQCADAGVTEGLIRMNVGIEDVEDLLNEFKEALA